jgi:hypothetical protein
MGIVPKIVMLGLAAVLGAPSRQHQIDFRMPSPNSIERINQLWLVTFIDGAGQEVVVQGRLASDDYVPLIAADPSRLESIMSAARELAKTRNMKLRLIKFTNRLDIEDIAP